MIDNKCINDIKRNLNPGIEHEITLFYRLCQLCKMDIRSLNAAIAQRPDADKIMAIVKISSPDSIVSKLEERSLSLLDVSLETQNDNMGPADIVLKVTDHDNRIFSIGLSVKHSNNCTLNVTGRRFLTQLQIDDLSKLLHNKYTQMYIDEMNREWGDCQNWFRKRKPSKTTDQFIDLIRDAVIANWCNIDNKEALFAALYHSDSPIEFWVVKYGNKGYTVNTTPTTIDFSRVNEVEIRKHQTSYVAFYIDNIRIGHLQVKFNNGFIERCKKSKPDIVEQNEKISYGKPFTSWNFSIENQ